MKYKPCCGRKCLNGYCEIRDNGGCYCACRLSDYINTLKKLIDGTQVHANMYFPDPIATQQFYEKNKEECDRHISKAPIELEKALIEFKKYELEG